MKINLISANDIRLSSLEELDINFTVENLNRRLGFILSKILKDPTNSATGEFARGYRQALIDIEQELISE